MNNVKITNQSKGPFVVLVTDPLNLKDEAFPMVISPLNGYHSKEDALSYIKISLLEILDYTFISFN
jgi:hypothetical protein